MVMSTSNTGGLISGAARNTGGTMEITLLRGCVVNQLPHKRGDQVDTDEATARYLIRTDAAKEGSDDKIKPLPNRVKEPGKK